MNQEGSMGSNSKEDIMDENDENMMDEPCMGSPQKRRGRPEKKPEPFFEEGQ